VLDAGYFPAVFAVVGSLGLMPDELLPGLRMLAFAQPGEVFGADWFLQAPLPGKLPLPLAETLLVTAPVVLLLGDQLTRMIALCLAYRKRFRDGEHGECSYLASVLKSAFIPVFLARRLSLSLLFDFFKGWEHVAASVDDTLNPDSILTNPKKNDVMANRS
jgi:hypothetical protein